MKITITKYNLKSVPYCCTVLRNSVIILCHHFLMQVLFCAQQYRERIKQTRAICVETYSRYGVFCHFLLNSGIVRLLRSNGTALKNGKVASCHYMPLLGTADCTSFRPCCSYLLSQIIFLLLFLDVVLFECDSPEGGSGNPPSAAQPS